MALKSMTGFSAAAGMEEGMAWRWEVRTLNGRGLDIRVRTPPGYEDIEARARELTSRSLARGSCQLSLQFSRGEASAEWRLNETALATVLDLARKLVDEAGASPPAADGLLRIKGVVETGEREPEGEVRERLVAAVLAGLSTALDGLAGERQREGSTLETVLGACLEEISALRLAIAALPAREPPFVLERLRAQVARLMEARAELPEDRLYQEAAILATKADIREELDRLQAHIDAARAQLASDGPAGRRLDFLAQELNREANTICAKSNDVETSRLGVDLKAVIDRFKEQVQNVE